MTTSFIIDRIEADIAIVEQDERTFEIPVALLPEGSKEGDRLQIQRLPPSSDDSNEARLERLKSRDSGDDIIDL